MKFSDRLKELGFASYSAYLASEGWQNFRARYKASGFRLACLVCSSRPVQLHHKTYIRLGRERFTDIAPLCREHHVAVHEWLKSSGRNFVEYTHEAILALGGVPDQAQINSEKVASAPKKRKKLKRKKPLAVRPEVKRKPYQYYPHLPKKKNLQRIGMADHTRKMKQLVSRFLELKGMGIWASAIPSGYSPRTDDHNLEEYVNELEKRRSDLAGI